MFNMKTLLLILAFAFLVYTQSNTPVTLPVIVDRARSCFVEYKVVPVELATSLLDGDIDSLTEVTKCSWACPIEQAGYNITQDSFIPQEFWDIVDDPRLNPPQVEAVYNLLNTCLPSSAHQPSAGCTAQMLLVKCACEKGMDEALLIIGAICPAVLSTMTLASL